MRNTYIFDLDGTLLDTLADLAASVNYALRTCGLPERRTDEVRAFLGNGIRHLMQKAVSEGQTDETFEAAFAAFRAHYMEHCLDRTAPYPGVIALLQRLKARGAQTAIVSNKLDPAVQALSRRFFDGLIDVAVGERPGVRRKPWPDSVLEAMRALDAKPEETVYVGDSEVDLLTAQRAGLPCVLVAWGFRDEDFLRTLDGEKRIVRSAEEIEQKEN